MDYLILFLTASLVWYKSSSKKLSVTKIGNTNCSLLFPESIKFKRSKTKALDELYFAEHRQKKTSYGVICALLAKELSADESFQLLTSYMNGLHKPFYTQYNTGISKVENGCINNTVLSDYWQDKNGCDWQVKGYTNGGRLAVLYVKNINDATVENQDEFLDSFSFGH